MNTPDEWEVFTLGIALFVNIWILPPLKKIMIRVWCHTAVIPSLRRQKQWDFYKFEVSLGYIESSRPAKLWKDLVS